MFLIQLLCIVPIGMTLGALETRPDVIALNRSSFDDIVTSNERVLVAFYRPLQSTDEYLSKARPNFLAAAKALAERGFPVQLAEMNVDADPGWHEFSLFRKMSIGPFIRYYCQGKEAYSRWSQKQAWKYFSESYDPVLLVEWMVVQPCPMFNRIDNETQLQQLTTDNDVVLLGLFDEIVDHDPTWTGRNETIREMHFAVFRALNESFGLTSAVSDAASLRQKYSADGREAVLLFRTYEDSTKKIFNLEESLESGPIHAFIRRASSPLVISLTTSSIMQRTAFSEAIEYHLVVFYSKKNNDSEQILQLSRRVSAKFSSVAFVAADLDTGGYTLPLYDLFGRGELPLIRMIQLVNTTQKSTLSWTKQLLKFRPDDLIDDSFTDDSMEAFVQAVISNKIKPFQNVERLDKSRKNSVVKLLNSDNFDSVVMKRTSHVMVFIYVDGAPNTEECKRAFWRLARNHRDDETKVVFAAVDLYKNDIDGLDTPTVRFFKRRHHFYEDFDPYFYIRHYQLPLLPRLEDFYSDLVEKWAKPLWNEIYDNTKQRTDEL